MQNYPIKVAGIDPESIVNGPGLRYTIYVQGCSHNCKGCHNPQTHDYNDPSVPEYTISDILKDYAKYDKISSGITLSGGDPLYHKNLEPVTELAKEFRKRYPNKTIWLYTGFTYENVKYREIFQYIDVVVDGKFEIDKKSLELPFRGSSNQRIINVKDGSLLFESKGE